MLKKILKYEIKSIKIPLIISVVCPFIFGLVARIFDYAISYETMFFAIFIFNAAFCCSIFFTMLFPLIFSVMNFRKRLLTDEAYLSFTLPVKISDHVLSRILLSLLLNAVSFCVFILSMMLRFASKEFFSYVAKFFQGIADMFTFLFNYEPLHLTLFSIELTLLIAVFYFSNLLLSFFYMTFIKNDKKKNFLTSLIFTAIVYASFPIISALLYTYSRLITLISNPYVAIHIVLWTLILSLVGFGYLCWRGIISRLSKHLNIY